MKRNKKIVMRIIDVIMFIFFIILAFTCINLTIYLVFENSDKEYPIDEVTIKDLYQYNIEGIHNLKKYLNLNN